MKLNTANWKTTLTGIAAGLVLVMTFLASQPFTNGELALIVPAEWKPYLALVGIVCAGVLATVRGLVSADASKVAVLENEVKALQDELRKTLEAPNKRP